MENEELERLFLSAHNEDKEALDKLIEMFKPYILKKSYMEGRFNEDCFQELYIKFLNCIKQFEFREKDINLLDFIPEKINLENSN